jgi:hypothetical protein
MQTILYSIAIAYLIVIVFLLAELAWSSYAEKKAEKKIQKQISLNLSKKNNMKTLDQLIAETKGKFFSVTFVKKDGSSRTINGKDKYLRLIAGTKENPNVNPVRNAGYVSFVNRNKESWASAHKDAVLVFKCGEIKAEFEDWYDWAVEQEQNRSFLSAKN